MGVLSVGIFTIKSSPYLITAMNFRLNIASCAGTLIGIFATILPLRATPFFMTHHSPVGAWSSMTFGLPGMGVGIETEDLRFHPTGDLIVACSHGAGKTAVFPFLAGAAGEDYEGAMAGNAILSSFNKWKAIASSEIQRTLTPATDEFRGGGIRLRVTSPRFPMEKPPEVGKPAAEILPALLLEVEIDNTTSDSSATGFIGLAYRGAGRLRPLDWVDAKLAGIGFQDRWALAAKASDEVFTIRAGSVAPFVESGTAVIHPGGNEGGIGFRVPAHTKRTLTAVLGFYRPGKDVAQGEGMANAYAYTAVYPSVEAVCTAALSQAEAIRVAAGAFDARLTPSDGNPILAELMAQASQGYYANSSLLRDHAGNLLWSISEGQFAWRNTLDLAADHLPYELSMHPWVAGNVIDSFIDRYSYRDTVRFDGETKAAHPGGIAFTHDQGNYTAYAPAGRGAYEQSDRTGVYSFMTTEQLLNGAFCASAYALKGGDKPWAKARLPVACEILASMENREHFDSSKRNGLLVAQSDRVGTGVEITTYDALDTSLQDSRGSLYIAVKTWTAALMLEQWFAAEGDSAYAARARSLADRAASALERSYRDGPAAFPPNLIEGGDALVFAALDPMAVPLFCGLGDKMGRYRGLLDKLRAHGSTCMATGKCLDANTGGLRLSSSTPKTWPSKVALSLSSFAWLEGKPATEIAPSIIPELAGWLQVSAASTTLSDQIDASTRKQISGAYYPRLVSLISLFPGSVSNRSVQDRPGTAAGR